MGHMRLKGKIKKISIKFIIMLLLIYISFIYTIYFSFKSIGRETNEEFISFLLSDNDPGIINEKVIPKVINKSLNYLLKVDFTNPESFLNDSIFGYHDDDDNIDIEKLKEVSYYMSDPMKREIKDPIVYIYNTHQLENYNSSDSQVLGISPNVLMVAYLLKEKLNEAGIKTIVEDTNITEFLRVNNWDYGASYRASRIFMVDKQNTYPTLKYYVDIHRDSVSRDITTVNIDGKSYARILFVIGLEHSNYKANLEVSNNVNALFNKYYPGLSRGIYKKEGPGVNGIYNQDISHNSILIEVGGYENKIDEVYNTIEVLSEILKEIING